MCKRPVRAGGGAHAAPPHGSDRAAEEGGAQKGAGNMADVQAAVGRRWRREQHPGLPRTPFPRGGPAHSATAFHQMLNRRTVLPDELVKLCFCPTLAKPMSPAETS